MHKKGGHSALKHAFNVLNEGDRKGGYVGSFNTLGKIGKHSGKSTRDGDAPRKRKRRTRKYNDDDSW